MGRTRRFLHGVSIGYTTQALITLIGLWLTPFLLGRIGQAEYGLWLVATQILSYLLLIDLGIVAILPRDTATAVGTDASGGAGKAVPRTVASAAYVVLLQWPLAVAAAAGVWLLLPDRWEPLRGPLAIVFAVYAAGFPLRMFQAILTGLQDLAFVGLSFLISWIASTATVVALVLDGWGLSAIAIGWTVQQVAMFGFCAIRLAVRHRSALPRRLGRDVRTGAAERVRRGAWVSLTQLAQALIFGSDILIIGALVGSPMVVPYSVTGKLLAVLSHQPALFAQMAVPALAEMRASELRQRLLEVTGALSQGLLLIGGGIAVAVLAVNRAFVSWWVGPQHWAGVGVLLLLVLAMLLRQWNLSAISTLFAFGHERRISVTTLADGAVTVVMSAVLIAAIGIAGAPLGSIIGVSCVSLPLNLTALSRELGIHRGAVHRPLRPWLWRFLLLAVVALSVGERWHPSSFLGVALTALASAVIYTLAMVPIVLRPPLAAYVRPRLAALRTTLGRRLAGREARVES